MLTPIVGSKGAGARSGDFAPLSFRLRTAKKTTGNAVKNNGQRRKKPRAMKFITTGNKIYTPLAPSKQPSHGVWLNTMDHPPK